MTPNGIEKDGIMCTSQDDAVYLGIRCQQMGDVATDKKVGTFARNLPVLYQRDPHRTSLARNMNVGIELGYFHLIGMTAYSARGGHNAHMARLRYPTYAFCRRTDDTQDPVEGIYLGKVVLLNRPQCLGTGRITPQDDQTAPHPKQMTHGLKGESIHYLERARTVRGTRIIAQI